MRQRRSSIPFVIHKDFTIALILAAMVVFFVCLYGSSFFFTKTIIIQGYNKKEPLYGLKALSLMSLLFTDETVIQNHLLHSNPKFLDITIKKQFPSTISLRVTVNEPVAYVALAKGYAVVGRKGKVLEHRTKKNASYPAIYFYQPLDNNLKTGQTVSYSELNIAFSIIDKFKSMHIDIDSVDISSLHVVRLTLKGKPIEILLSTERSVDLQLYYIEKFMKKSKITGTQYKRIDVRFDKPVIEL